MSYFHYVKNQLFCEKVQVEKILRKTGTPAFIYSYNSFVDNFKSLTEALRPLNPLICYSVKANSNLAVLKTLVSRGSGLDIVSGGELFRAKKSGCPSKKIVFAGVGKTDDEIRNAVRSGILLFNVESVSELNHINTIAKGMRKKVNVSLRVNPDVDANTHAHITTGKAENKFGISLKEARDLFLNKNKFPSLFLCGIHVHIGSQIEKAAPFVKAFKKIVKFADELKVEGSDIKYLNLGGGLGVTYNKEKPESAKSFAKKIIPILKGKKYKIIFEPGRFIAANSGILAGKVLYIKKTRVKKFVITDSAMNDLIRPALYDAYHNICPVSKKTGAREVYDVVGPICESGDCFAKNRSISKLSEGDYVAIMSAGAYGFVMSSNYNSRPRSSEVLVKGNKFFVVKERESLEDLVRKEKIPKII